MRNVLAVIGVSALTVASASMLTAWLMCGAALAVAAGCVVCLECLKHRDDRIRRYRMRVWERRDYYTDTPQGREAAAFEAWEKELQQ